MTHNLLLWIEHQMTAEHGIHNVAEDKRRAKFGLRWRITHPAAVGVTSDDLGGVIEFSYRMGSRPRFEHRRLNPIS